MATTLGVSTVEYAPWAIMCYLGFILAWVYGYSGKAVWKENNIGVKAEA